MAIVDTAQTAAGTGSSVVVERCQICNYAPLRQILFAGYLPPVNQMRTIGQLPNGAAGVPGAVAGLPTMHAGATWVDRGQADSVSSGIPVYQRYDEDPAREFCGAVYGVANYRTDEARGFGGGHWFE